MKHFIFTLTLMLIATTAVSQKNYQLKSPDARLQVNIQVDKAITYSILHDGDEILAPSQLAVELETGKVFGVNSTLRNAQEAVINQVVKTHGLYKRNEVKDYCNQLTLTFREDFSLIFRAYDEGIAYRFVSTGKKEFTVKDEKSVYNFKADHNCYIPYVNREAGAYEPQYFNSFENTYTYTPLSGIHPNHLAFSPVVVEIDKGRKVCLAEADVESYPGMFLTHTDGTTTLKGHFAPVPSAIEQGGHNQLQGVVTAREAYIARCKGGSKLPWRIVIVSTEDKQLADNDMVYKLAAPSRIKDTSWIRPGKVAWEWWNNWGIYNVDFAAGINNKTYKAYIDFASRNGIEYVILDEGWAVNLQADLFQVVPEINLEKLVAYGKSKGVDIILWAGYYAFDREMERICKHYSEMGVKGFKIDFMDRDDQPMVDFHYKAAEIAAKYKLLVDFHGTYKPTGLHRTYPNVINFEGVHGLEQMKWSDIKTDQVTYDVTAPFIRQIAGPMDYTQGAMRNGTRYTYHSNYDEPVSQGTRCRQLAEYVIFESPLNMLCDTPNNYEREPECTEFISKIPTVWSETVALNGEIAQYITIARRKIDTWYVGSLTNWDARTLELDLSFLGEGKWKAEIFRDGVNAHRSATDYVKEEIAIPSDRKLTVKMAPGGGMVMKIEREG